MSLSLPKILPLTLELAVRRLHSSSLLVHWFALFALVQAGDRAPPPRSSQVCHNSATLARTLMADLKSSQPPEERATSHNTPDEGETLVGHDSTPSSSTSLNSGFSKGQILAQRFRILRFVARGGMGEVYEAEDLELNERVALKTVRFEMADNERTVERFKREIQLGRKVTHPNVCRTFDVFRHVEQDGQGVSRET